MTLDKAGERRVFTFAGYNNQPDAKADLVHKITCVGGHVHDGAAWTDEVTHVVAANFGQFLEKVRVDRYKMLKKITNVSSLSRLWEAWCLEHGW